MNKIAKYLTAFSSIIHQLTIPITFILAIYGVITIFDRFHKPNPEISVAITTVDQITSLPQVTDLKAEFKYRGRVVKDLWRVRLRIFNSGKSTIIGEGEHKNLIHDSLPIHINRDFDLIGFEIEQKDFQISVSRSNSNTVQLKFLQWKNSEAFSLLLFLERKNVELGLSPNIFSCERELERGDISVFDASNPKNLNRKPLLEKWVSRWWARIIRSGLYCFSALLIILGGLVFYATFTVYLNETVENEWRRNFRNSAIDFLRLKMPSEDVEKILQGKFELIDTQLVTTILKNFEGKAPGSMKWFQPGEEPTPKATLATGSIMTLLMFAIGIFNFAAIWKK